MIDSILFFILLVCGIGFFIRNSKKIIAAIHLGTPLVKLDRKKERWVQMFRLAFGQQKMHRNLLVGLLHLIVYLGFIIINIELLEIIIDGLLGTHRIFKDLGVFYDFAIATFEIFAFLVVVSVVVFWMRRNVMRIARFLPGTKITVVITDGLIFQTPNENVEVIYDDYRFSGLENI
ncbi:MAG: hypothetical protein VW010_07040, partial [Flavobacteriaceae bacterium]